MTLFALSDNVWLAIIGVIAMIAKDYLDRLRHKEADEKIEVVKTVTLSQDAKIDTIATDVRKVELATNSMKDQLVLKTEAEGLARGANEERQRADAKKEGDASGKDST